MGCKICKCDQVNLIIEPVRVVSFESSTFNSINSIQTNKKNKYHISTKDDYDEQIINSLNNPNFVEIEVADREAFNNLFIQQRQQAINNQYYRSTVESWRPTSLSQLVSFIQVLSQDKPLIDYYWIIFYWITYNIEYDTISYFSKKYVDQSAENVFRTKKSVCAGYANIYKYLCNQLNISCKIVNGYAKGYGFDEYENALKQIDHVWNAIEIDHHWYLIESTWGSGYITDEKIFKHELNSYYFCPHPNEMIYYHLPENETWQLLRKPIKNIQYLQMPKIHPIYFKLNFELINPRYQTYVNLLPNKSYALVHIRTPSNVYLIADLKLNDKKIPGGHRVLFDKEKQLYSCYFAPNTIGKHKITIYGKRDETEIDTYKAAIELTLEIKKMPKNPISFPQTWKNFFDLNLNIISPKNTHLIKIHNQTYTEILIQTPNDVELLGRLVDINGEKIKNAYQVFYDRYQDLWQCKFAPNQDGIFDAEILVKKKSDTGLYTTAVSFTIDAKFIPTSPLSYPQTWQLFYDFDLKIEAPRDRATAIWPENASFTEIRISAPDDVQLSCALKYNDVVNEANCSLAQFDHDKQQWQLLFAPQHTGAHELIIYARRTSDLKTKFACVAEFDLNVTKLRKAIKFPLTYNQFQTDKCRIYEPLNGILKKETIVPIHCFIPGAAKVALQVNSKWLDVEHYYKDPILKTEITVGSTDVIIYAKYGQNRNYGGLIRYFVR